MSLHIGPNCRKVMKDVGVAHPPGSPRAAVPISGFAREVTEDDAVLPLVTAVPVPEQPLFEKAALLREYLRVPATVPLDEMVDRCCAALRVATPPGMTVMARVDACLVALSTSAASLIALSAARHGMALAAVQMIAAQTSADADADADAPAWRPIDSAHANRKLHLRRLLAYAPAVKPAELERALELHSAFLASGGRGGTWQSYIGDERIPFGHYQAFAGGATRGVQACFHLRTLDGATLRGAGLHLADLSCARCEGADLSCADLRGALLIDGCFSKSSFAGADLRFSDLSRADLVGCDFRGADLRSADLEDADLTGADLRGAHLGGAKTPGALLDLASAGGTASEEEDRLHAAFALFDIDGNGTLSAAEMVGILTRPASSSTGSQQPLSLADARALIDEFDADGDGQLDLTEWVTACSAKD